MTVEFQMIADRTDLTFTVLAIAGLACCIFPGLVFGPAETAYAVWSGKQQLVPVAGIMTFYGMITGLGLLGLGRMLFLWRRRLHGHRLFTLAWAGLTCAVLWRLAEAFASR